MNMNIYYKGERNVLRMELIKFFVLFGIFVICVVIGMLIARKYTLRLNELKEMKKGLQMLESKLKFTYEKLPIVFEEIGHAIDEPARETFCIASENMQYTSAENSWNEALTQMENEGRTNLKHEDLETLKTLGKMLGKTNMEGQVNQIKLVDTFLDTQIMEADTEKRKNDKMYKSLGIVAGLAIVILLV